MSLWNQIKADVFKRPVSVPQEPEVGILGAAMIAAVGLGWHSSLPDAARAMRAEVSHTFPDLRRSAIYEELYLLFSQLYPDLKPITAGLEARIVGGGK